MMIVLFLEETAHPKRPKKRKREKKNPSKTHSISINYLIQDEQLSSNISKLVFKKRAFYLCLSIIQFTFHLSP